MTNDMTVEDGWRTILTPRAMAEAHNIMERVFNALNHWLIGGPGCPGRGALGECLILQEAVSANGKVYFEGIVAWWPETPPDWRELVDILATQGADEIKVAHVLHDEFNDETDGRGPGGATLEFEFRDSRSSTTSRLISAPDAHRIRDFRRRHKRRRICARCRSDIFRRHGPRGRRRLCRGRHGLLGEMR